MCRVPSERCAPGDELRTAGWCGLPRFVRFMAGFPRTPLEPGYPPPGTQVRMPDATARPRGVSTRLSTNPRGDPQVVDNEASGSARAAVASAARTLDRPQVALGRRWLAIAR